jgi:hypothetical protein
MNFSHFYDSPYKITNLTSNKKLKEKKNKKKKLVWVAESHRPSGLFLGSSVTLEGMFCWGGLTNLINPF